MQQQPPSADQLRQQEVSRSKKQVSRRGASSSRKGVDQAQEHVPITEGLAEHVRRIRVVLRSCQPSMQALGKELRRLSFGS